VQVWSDLAFARADAMGYGAASVTPLHPNLALDDPGVRSTGIFVSESELGNFVMLPRCRP
jgi:hypothetical protein